jgi:hypothetical protein
LAVCLVSCFAENAQWKAVVGRLGILLEMIPTFGFSDSSDDDASHDSSIPPSGLNIDVSTRRKKEIQTNSFTAACLQVYLNVF